VVSVFSPVNVFIGTSGATTRSTSSDKFSKLNYDSSETGPGADAHYSGIIIPAYFYYFFSFRYLLF